MKYVTATQAVTGGNTENIELSISEILPVYLVDRLHLSVAVTGNKKPHSGVCRKLITICEKFAEVIRVIWKNFLRKTGPNDECSTVALSVI